MLLQDLAPPAPINRRQWLALAALGASANAVPAWATSTAAPADLPGEALPARLMDRITWGCTAQGARALAGMGREAWLAAQLRSPASAPLPAQAQAQIGAMAITKTPFEEIGRAHV